MVNNARNAASPLAAAMALGLLLGGCGSSIPTSSFVLPPASELPSLPQLPSLPAIHAHADASPIETFASVARGATSCWFGAGGRLKKTHIFYADAEPPTNGGKAEIALHERDATGPTPRGAKVYRISLSADGTGTSIEHINHKLPDDLVAGIEADVQRFARGDLSCALAGATAPKLDPLPVDGSPATTVKAKPRPTARSGG